VSVPEDVGQAQKLFKNLYNTAASRHVALVFNRLRRKDRLTGLSNIATAGEVGWGYLDTIEITYERPYSSSNNAFLPVSETAHLLFKGQVPDPSRTKWFNEDGPNATTHWDVAPQPSEGTERTYCQRFNWEISLLLMSLMGNLEHRKFILACPVNKNEISSILGFCEKYQISADILTNSKETQQMIQEALSRKGGLE
jgi:hypothetical protein